MLERWFHLTERGTNVRTEVLAGLATFMTMAYIVVLNPLILGGAADHGGRHLDQAQIAAVTALVAGVMTLLMGVVANYPFALAAGLGLNGVVAFQLAPRMSWPDAMGVVVVEGLVITLLVLTRFRQAVLDAVPLSLKRAISVGIGLFIAIIGFVDAGFVRRTGAPPVPLELGVGGRLVGWPALVFAAGLLLTLVLLARRVPAALIIAIAANTLLAIMVERVAHVGPAFSAAGSNPRGWALNVPAWPHTIVARPHFDLLGHFSLGGSFARVGVLTAALFVFTLLLADFFDTMGTMIGVAAEGDLLDDDGRLPGAERVLLIDSLAAAAGGAASASSNTTYIESAAGVSAGGRTGLTAATVGILFFGALFVTPLVRVVPYEAASPVLVAVGFLLMMQVREIDWSDLAVGIPAFLTMVLMPFTYSITNGIGAGIVAHTVIATATGRRRDVPMLLWIVTAAFAVYFAIDPVERLLT